MQFSNGLYLAVAALATSAVALPVSYPKYGADSSGAGAAGSQCSDEGRVVCSNGQFQICASGAWSSSMNLAMGTDCSVFGTDESGGSGSLPSNSDAVPVAPVPVVPSSQPSVEPITPAPESNSASSPQAAQPVPENPSPAPQQPDPESSPDALEPEGLKAHQTFSDSPSPTSSIVSTPSQPSSDTSGSQQSPSPGNDGASSNSGGGSSTPAPYQHYQGGEDAYPGPDKWLNFDTMWELNSKVCNGPQNDGKGDVIKQNIQKVAGESGMDPRVILAVILQESTCLLSAATTNGGVSNPGIMQSHNGVSFDGTDNSILQMIKDGVMGTSDGDGLMQSIEQKGGLYTGLRAYNSGPNGVDESNLENLPAGTGTASYCDDIANRLTGGKVESQ